MNPVTKAFEDKVSAQLQEAKAKIEEIEARAKVQKAQAQIDALKHLEKNRLEIETARHALKTLGEAKAAEAKAEIEAKLTKLRASVDEVGAKLKSHAATK
jgi:hypothetical protein